MPKLLAKTGRPPMRRNTPEEEAAIQRGIAADPDTHELSSEEIRALRPFAELLAERRADYRVEWSGEDQEYVGLCAGFPSLSWLDKTPEAALAGIRRLVAECVADRIERLGKGEPLRG